MQQGYSMKVTAVFDIGKTNKKFFLFDENYQEVFKTYVRFDEITDEDGFPCDDLSTLQEWVISTFNKVVNNKKWVVSAVNFSTYGASFVHLDKNGEPITPLYNYLKPYPPDILQSFYKKYGNSQTFAQETASPSLGMLNAGLQLYWLKYAQPNVFEKIRWSLHFPQYLSYLITGIPISDFTSIGCHTGLWDYSKKDYHHWVYAEGIDRILAPIVRTDTSINGHYNGQKIKVGTGIHDSSGALLPYIRADKKPFLLISTGTWSISLNPFNQAILSDKDLQNDCLNFMRIDGRPVKAARLFLGNEYKIQIKKLQQFFKVDEDAHKKISFNQEIYEQLTRNYRQYFSFETLPTKSELLSENRFEKFAGFEAAYHQLMLELMELQIEAAERAIGKTKIYKIYIDGGFADNDLFVKLLSRHFQGVKLRTTQSPLGSALGAAMVISDRQIRRKFLKKHYAMKKCK